MIPPFSDPYIQRGPVTGVHFYDRVVTMSKVQATLPTHNLIVIGMRMMGKSSILKEVEVRLENDEQQEYLPLYLNLQSIEAASDRALKELKNELSRKKRIYKALKNLPRRTRDSFEAVISDVAQVVKEHNSKLLLLIDETEKLCQLEEVGRCIETLLSDDTMGGESIRIIATASPRIYSIEIPIWLTNTFDSFREHPLGAFDLGVEGEASKLCRLTQIETSHSIQDTEVVRQIVQASGGHPCLIQELCSSYLNEGSFLAAKKSLTNSKMLSDQFHKDIDNLEYNDKIILFVLAKSIGSLDRTILATKMGVDVVTIEGRFDALKSLGLLSEETETGIWKVANEFFKDWLNRKLAREESKAIKKYVEELLAEPEEVKDLTKPWKWSTFILAGILTIIGATYLFSCFNEVLFPKFGWGWLIFVAIATVLAMGLESTIVVADPKARKIMHWIFGIMLAALGVVLGALSYFSN